MMRWNCPQLISQYQSPWLRPLTCRRRQRLLLQRRPRLLRRPRQSLPEPTATPTLEPTATDTPESDPVASPEPGHNLLANGDFEAGIGVWDEQSLRDYGLVCNDASCESELDPHSGAYVAWLGGANYEHAQIEQTLDLPAGVAATLDYWYRIESADECGYDYGDVLVATGDETIALRRFSLCRDEETGGWVNEQLDLSAYAGEQITLLLRVETDVWLSSSLFVDDVAVYSGGDLLVNLPAEIAVRSVVEPVPGGVPSRLARPQQ